MTHKTILVLITAACICNCSGNGPIETTPPYLTDEDMAHPTLSPEDVGLVLDEATGEWIYPE